MSKKLTNITNKFTKIADSVKLLQSKIQNLKVETTPKFGISSKVLSLRSSQSQLSNSEKSEAEDSQLQPSKVSILKKDIKPSPTILIPMQLNKMRISIYKDLKAQK